MLLLPHEEVAVMRETTTVGPSCRAIQRSLRRQTPLYFARLSAMQVALLHTAQKLLAGSTGSHRTLDIWRSTVAQT